MFNLSSVIHPRTKVAPDRPLKDFHHESEQGPRESSIPAPFGLLISDEGMLGLDFKKLRTSQIVNQENIINEIELERLTEAVTLALSKVARIRSRPARGTWVSW